MRRIVAFVVSLPVTFGICWLIAPLFPGYEHWFR